MTDVELHRLWAAVRQDFDRARALLPTPTTESEGSILRLTEWLDHNELELALGELEYLGVDNAVPLEYWQYLRSAAEQMGLIEYVARLNRLCFVVQEERRDNPSTPL